MKILYLHGLDGSLKPEKRKVLENFGQVIAPNLDYRANNKIVTYLYNKFSSKKIDFIIGSSMGGYAGFFVSIMLNKPALVFNPALPYRNVLQFIPKINLLRKKYIKIIIGKQDKTIFAADNVNFLMNTISEQENIKFSVISNLAHRIPIAFFKQEVELFFQEI